MRLDETKPQKVLDGWRLFGSYWLIDSDSCGGIRLYSVMDNCESRATAQPASRAFSGDFHAPPTPHGQRPIAVLSLGSSQAAVYHERGEITHAMEFRIRIHPVDIGLPDFIGLAIHDENLSGRNLLDVAVKCRTDG
jgi:hypothetical protein